MERSTIVLAIGFVLLWNSGFIGAEYGLPFAGPFTLLFWRYLGLTMVVVCYLLARNRFQWVGWEVAGIHMLIGILAHGMWLTCVLLALDADVPAGIVALVVSLQPLATGTLSSAFTGEGTHFYQWVGLVLGFLGVVLTVTFRMDFGSYNSIFGYLIPLGSVIGITVASLIQRRMEVKKGIHKLPIDVSLFYQALATTLGLALPALFVEQLATEWVMKFVYTMAWLILSVSLIAYGLMWVLLQRLDATRVASLFYLGPPVTMVMTWLAFGDTILITDIIGLTVVFAGVLLTQFSKAKA
jgi:drug/metabolite transporter (DMT)-like permease